jgi:hypothetical protein
MKGIVLLAAFAATTGVGASGWAGTIYHDQAAWLAALAGQTVHDLTLTPQSIPPITTLGQPVVVVDDEVTVDFDGGWYKNTLVHADGWTSAIYASGDQPRWNIATFAAPISAFGAFVQVGTDNGAAADEAIKINFGDSTARVSRAEAPIGGAAFIGWIGSPVSPLKFTIDGDQLTTIVRNIEYVTAPAAVATPVPAAALGAVPLLGMLAARRRRRV